MSSAAGYLSARPRLKLDGQVQAALAEELLQSLIVDESTAGLFRCEARFANWGARRDAVGFLLFDRQLLDFGKDFEVEMGPPDAARRIFSGRISGLEAIYPAQRSPELTVLAEDRLQDLRMERRTRSFEDVSDADVVRRIASAHGLTAQVDVDGPSYAVLVQLNQSDLAFLRERMAAIDAELWVDGRTLHAQQRARRAAASLTLTYGQNLLEFSVLADLAHQRSAVRVSGWDPDGKQAIDESAQAAAISGELNGDEGGSAILERALAARREPLATASPLGAREATALAEARYRQRARRFLTGRGSTDGSATLQVGSRVTLKGLGTLFDGGYTVTRATHRFDLRTGLRTVFEVERPGLGR
jgi:phage protein D